MTSSSSHVNSPACALVATRCVCCSRKLSDALSVELGIGPDCRENHGFLDVPVVADWTPFHSFIKTLNDASLNGLLDVTDARKAANVIVHHAALLKKEDRGGHVNALMILGYRELACKVRNHAGRSLQKAEARARLAAKPVEVLIHVTKVDGSYRVRAPFSEVFNNEMRAARTGAYFVRDIQANLRYWLVPLTGRVALWNALNKAFKGGKLTTDGGESVL